MIHNATSFLYQKARGAWFRTGMEGIVTLNEQLQTRILRMEFVQEALSSMLTCAISLGHTPAL